MEKPYSIVETRRDGLGRLIVKTDAHDGTLSTWIEPRSHQDHLALESSFRADFAQPYPLPRGHLMFKAARSQKATT